jgi:hypothetical protein
MPVRLPLLTEHAARILFEGLVDYAGLFPPAALSMPQVVRNYAHYRAGGTGWMLGRFVCTASALELFSEKADPLLPRDAGAIPWRLSVTGTGDLAADLAHIAAFNERHRVCFEECGAVADAYEVKANSAADIARIAQSTPTDLTTYIEVALDDTLDAKLDAVAAAGRRAKIRTGGTTADAIPTSANVVRFLRGCIARELPFKATAGLHHPITGPYRLTYEPEPPVGRMFGFLTVLLATALLGNGGSDADAIALLEETDAEQFDVNDIHLAWRGPEGVVTFSRDTLLAVRTRALVSIGSCSFTEPVDESRALGWI